MLASERVAGGFHRIEDSIRRREMFAKWIAVELPPTYLASIGTFVKVENVLCRRECRRPLSKPAGVQGEPLDMHGQRLPKLPVAVLNYYFDLIIARRRLRNREPSYEWQTLRVHDCAGEEFD